MKTHTFDLSKFARCGIKSIVIKETAGADEDLAADLALAKGDSPSEELVRLSVVSYDGIPATLPFTQLDQWSTRTREIVGKCFNKVNGLTGLKGLNHALEGTPEAAGFTFDLSGVPLASVKSITLREVTGADESKALRTSLTNKTRYRDELFKLAMVAVDGEGDLFTWNTRTRVIAMSAYNKLNGTSSAEDPEFDAVE